MNVTFQINGVKVQPFDATSWKIVLTTGILNAMTQGQLFTVIVQNFYTTDYQTGRKTQFCCLYLLLLHHLVLLEQLR